MTDDPAGRMALAIAAGRLALGVAISASTRRALAGLGFDDPDAGTIALARLAGGRDIALGLHGLAARDDRGRLAESSAIATAVDAGDGIAFALALRSGGLGKRALVNVPLIAAAVGAGAWATSRLRRASSRARP
jgi:hypothetical protein